MKLICSHNKQNDGRLELNKLLKLRNKANIFIGLKIIFSCHSYIEGIWNKIPELEFKFSYETLWTVDNGR